MDLNLNDFKLSDYFRPALEEGKYTITAKQTVKLSGMEEKDNISDEFAAEKSFYVAANQEYLPAEEVYSIYPSSGQQGDFAGTLPFLVLKNPTYPWIRKWRDDINGMPVPWLALIVIAENENADELDVEFSKLDTMKKETGVYFSEKQCEVSSCKKDQTIHLLTIPKELYHSVMPAAEDLPWLTHVKFCDLSASEDAIAEQDGWFSTIIANRFIPSENGTPLKSTVHLVSVDGCLESDIPDDCNFVRMISLYHWSVYSEKKEDHSFISLTEGLSKNSGTVKDTSVCPHYLRTGEKTYSVYHAPLVSYSTVRNENINGEEKYTADGRLIYDSDNGIFDVSYSAAFNLGRLITLSNRSEAEKISAWRKNEAVNQHMNLLDAAIGITASDLEQLCINLTGGKLT